jgi:hypothetical protein
MRDEIVAGIRNALDRGYSLQQAVQSFINAGYNPSEVNEAAETFSGASHIAFGTETPANKQMFFAQPRSNQQMQNIPMQALPQMIEQEPKAKGRGIIIALVIILVLLLGVLAASIIFRDQILQFVRNF